MILSFEELTADEYRTFIESARRSYGDDLVRAELCDRQAIEDKTQQVFQQLLPDGQRSSGQSFFAVKDGELSVGQLWISRREDERGPYVGIYYLAVMEEQRRKGYGRAILEELRKRCAQEGVRTLRLHVFGHNEAARRLYESFGFVIRNVVMERRV